jgi:hypothetical protein
MAALEDPEPQRSKSFIDTDRIEPPPVKAIEVVGREPEAWSAESDKDEEEPMPELELSRPKRGRKPVLLECATYPDAKFTLQEVVRMTGAAYRTAQIYCRYGRPLGPDGLIFKRAGSAVPSSPVAVAPAAEPRDLICDKIPGEKFCASAAARTAGVTVDEILLSLVGGGLPVGKDGLRFRREAPPAKVTRRESTPARKPDRPVLIPIKSDPAPLPSDLIAERCRADLEAARTELATIDAQRAAVFWKVAYLSELLEAR